MKEWSEYETTEPKPQSSAGELGEQGCNKAVDDDEDEGSIVVVKRKFKPIVLSDSD